MFGKGRFVKLNRFLSRDGEQCVALTLPLGHIDFEEALFGVQHKKQLRPPHSKLLPSQYELSAMRGAMLTMYFLPSKMRDMSLSGSNTVLISIHLLSVYSRVDRQYIGAIQFGCLCFSGGVGITSLKIISILFFTNYRQCIHAHRTIRYIQIHSIWRHCQRKLIHVQKQLLNGFTVRLIR